MENAEYEGHVVRSSYHFRDLNYRLVDLISKSVPRMVQIPINNELLHAADGHGRCAKAEVASVQPVIFSLKNIFPTSVKFVPKTAVK